MLMKKTAHVLFLSFLTLVLITLVACAPAIKPVPAKSPGYGLYRFDQYKLSIEIPKAWETKTRGKLSGTAAFLRGGGGGYFKNKYGPHKFILSAYEEPYRGPDEQRSYVVCTATNASYASAKTVLKGMQKVYSMYPGGTPAGVRIGSIKKRRVGRKSGYGFNITIAAQGNRPRGTLEVLSVVHRNMILVCNGLYTNTKTNKTKVRHALRSIKLF
jgi:hypothetical protein